MSKRKKNKKFPIKIPLIFRAIHVSFPLLEKYASPVANKLAAFIFFSPMRFKAPEKELEAHNQAEKSIIKAAGKRIQVYVWGEGPSVLMTHGWSGRGTQFRKFIQPLNEAGYRVVSFDGPAHGKSEGRSTNVAEFNEVIQQLENKYGPFSCSIGHSFGGVANLYANVEGVNIKKMIMISTPTISDDLIDVFLKKLNASKERGEYLQKYIIEEFGVKFEDVSVLNLIEGFSNVPLLLIHDVDDKEVSIEHPEKLLIKYPKGELLKTLGLGHIRILKSPEVVQYCLDFINRSDPADNLKEEDGGEGMQSTR